MVVGDCVSGTLIHTTYWEVQRMTDTKIEIRRISPSQLGVWNHCEQQWHYGYVDKIVPKVKANYFAKGTLTHELLAVYYQLLQGGLKPGSETALQMTMEFAAEDLTFKQLMTGNVLIYQAVLQVVNRYIRDYSPVVDKGIKILGVEKEVQVLLETPKGRKFILEGIIDLIVQDFAGYIWILDHKSSGMARFWSQAAIEMDSQIPTYMAVSDLLGSPAHGFYLNEINTYPYNNFWSVPVEKLFRRTATTRTRKELAYILQNYLRAIDEQQDRLDQNITPVRNLSKNCERCPYREICMFDIKGVPTKDFIRQNFVTKDTVLKAQLPEDVDAISFG